MVEHSPTRWMSIWAQHPDYLFKQTPEHARIAPDNLGVLAAHVACATFELPFNTDEKLGHAHIQEILEALAEGSDAHASGGMPLPLLREGGDRTRFEGRDEWKMENRQSKIRYTWVGDNYPADKTSLRGVGDRIVIVCEGQMIGETGRATAPARVHVGPFTCIRARPTAYKNWTGRTAKPMRGG